LSEFIKSQQELRANLFEQIKEVIESAEADKRGLDAAEVEKIDRIEADIRRADEAIEIANRNEARKVEASVAAKGFVPAAAIEDDAAILRSIARGEIRGHTFEKRAMVPNDNLVGKSFFDEVYQVARLVGPMLDVGQRIDTGTGEQLTIPTLTAYSTATIKAAGSAIANSEPTFSNITLGAFKYSLLIPVSNELLNDSTINLTSLLAEQAGNGIGFAVNEGLTNGTGTVEPTGVVTSAGSGITGSTAVGGAFTADNLIDLQYSLDGAARRLPGVAYMTSTAGLGRMRKLKDDDGAYLYQVNVGTPDTFAGYNVIENPAIPAVGTGVVGSVLFGHMPSYIVRTAGGIQVATSTDYAFNQDVTTFRVTLRADGALTHAGHIKYFKGGAS
jgi:HK97 family phage major capsid protein